MAQVTFIHGLFSAKTRLGQVFPTTSLLVDGQIIDIKKARISILTQRSSTALQLCSLLGFFALLPPFELGGLKQHLLHTKVAVASKHLHYLARPTNLCTREAAPPRVPRQRGVSHIQRRLVPDVTSIGLSSGIQQHFHHLQAACVAHGTTSHCFVQGRVAGYILCMNIGPGG